MALKKVDKEFCLTDDTVNVYGYRLLTSGMQLERFNPAIGFLMHNREQGVAVRWEDFRIENEKVYAKPVVNESKFPQLAQQIEDGFYSACSVGHIVALEMSDDPKLKLEGQTGITVTKWFPRECSIVDIPGNYNALAQLYDEKDTLLHDLSDVSSLNNNNMDKDTIKISDLHLPDLSAESTAEQVQTKIADLLDRASRTDRAEQELKDLKATHNKERVDTIIDNGKKSHKLTNELADKLARDYANNPDGLKDLVESMPAQQSVVPDLTDIPEKFKGKKLQDLYLSGELEEVKTNFPNLYEKLKNEK